MREFGSGEGRRPAGRSIGRALDLPAGPLHDDLRETIAAIDRVHGVFDLPRIPVRYSFALTELGRFLFDPATGDPISILVRSNQAHPRFSLLHEIGHFLDLAALGVGNQFGTRVNSALEDWSRAVAGSSAFQVLRDVGRRGSADMFDPDANPRRVPITQRERDFIDEWLQPEELWARSYAQFIATHVGLPVFIAGLESFRVRVPGTVYYPLQWDDEDFAEIAKAIDILCGTIGWRR
jgi:hypothetical protein